MPDYKIIDLDLLKINSFGPRLPQPIKGKPEPEILNFMLVEYSLTELMLAIGSSGFSLVEPLIVVRNESNTYTVLNGGRRLAALKFLANPQLATVQNAKIAQILHEVDFIPTQIPCLIFEREEEILKHLGYSHITGAKGWRLFEKAAYLFQVWKSTFPTDAINQASRKLAKMMGCRKIYIANLLAAYLVFEAVEQEGFFGIKGLNQSTFSFDHLVESVSKPNLTNFLGISPAKPSMVQFDSIALQNIGKWTHWLFEKNDQNRSRVHPDIENLALLDAVIGHSSSFKAFDEEGVSLETAYIMSQRVDEEFDRLIQSAFSSLEKADRIAMKANNHGAETLEYLGLMRILSTRIGRAIQEKEQMKR